MSVATTSSLEAGMRVRILAVPSNPHSAALRLVHGCCGVITDLSYEWSGLISVKLDSGGFVLVTSEELERE